MPGGRGCAVRWVPMQRLERSEMDDIAVMVMANVNPHGGMLCRSRFQRDFFITVASPSVALGGLLRQPSLPFRTLRRQDAARTGGFPLTQA